MYNDVGKTLLEDNIFYIIILFYIILRINCLR